MCCFDIRILLMWDIRHWTINILMSFQFPVSAKNVNQAHTNIVNNTNCYD